ncbi:MAG: hypothetical protein KKB02_14980, partial [Alphaproteobacteria bacterium]|nr:hypothetical protein [Alphaproteobacteria bacterium]
MHLTHILKTATAVAAVLSLAGCLGSSSGPSIPTTAPSGGPTGGTTGGSTTGGGTTGGTTKSSQAAFDAKALSYNAGLVPTSRPISGAATYKGEISMLTLANPSDQTEALIGNLDMGVNFGSGVANPVTATAGNFAGKVNGQATTVKGTLSTANALANDANSVTATTTPAGTITGLAATLRGTISDPSGALSGDARMILGGNFKETGG